MSAPAVTTPSPAACSLLEGEPSFRDLGGCTTSDGRRVRPEKLYRAGLLRALTPTDERRLRGAGIAWRLDLRNRAERAREKQVTAILDGIPAAVWEGEDELAGVQPSQWAQRLRDPGFTSAKARELFLEAYREMPRALAPALRVLFARLLHATGTPVLIHCTAGKDRTGFVCALLLLTLGASEEAVFADYLRSNDHMPDPRVVLARYRQYDSVEPHADAAAVVETMYRAEADYLDCALRRVRADWGSTEEYLREAAGCSPAVREALRSSLLPPR